MPDMRELYQEIILDHNKAPRNYRKPDDANREAEGYNPLCGDHYTVFARVDSNQQITDIGFEGVGCAISKAAASMMTSMVKGKSVEEAERCFENYRQMITGGKDYDRDALGKLVVFSEVCNYPTRIKCAILCWHTLHAALNNLQEPVTTE